MRLIFIYGPAAAGKYTIGKALSELSGVPLFHNHLCVDLCKSLFEFGTPGFVSLREQIWLDAFAAAADADQSLIFTFQPEGSVRPDFVSRVEATIERAGGTVLYVALTCPDEELEKRVENASRAEFGKLNSLPFYRELRDSGAFDFPPMPEPLLTIASDQVTPDEAARLIWARMGRVATD